MIVDVHNDTDTPEQLHWHGQFVPVDVDGAAEEGTPFIPAHGMRRISFTPRPAGFRLLSRRTTSVETDLHAGQYSGQVGPVYIEPRHEPGDYDREVFLVLKEFEPFLSRGGDMAMDFLAPAAQVRTLKEAGRIGDESIASAKGTPHGYEVGYRFFSIINGRILGHGELGPREKAARARFVSRAQWQRDGNSKPGPSGSHVQGRSLGWQSRADACGGSGAVAGHGRANFGDCGDETSRRMDNGRSGGR